GGRRCLGVGPRTGRRPHGAGDARRGGAAGGASAPLTAAPSAEPRTPAAPARAAGVPSSARPLSPTRRGHAGEARTFRTSRGRPAAARWSRRPPPGTAVAPLVHTRLCMLPPLSCVAAVLRPHSGPVIHRLSTTRCG